MAVLLAVYTATKGIGARVVLEVTFTIIPYWRARNCGSTACVIAITPTVLVSNTSRMMVIGVASKAPNKPMPELLTSTSIGPQASSVAIMLSGLVASSDSTRNRDDGGKISSRGWRMVAITFQP